MTPWCVRKLVKSGPPEALGTRRRVSDQITSAIPAPSIGRRPSHQGAESIAPAGGMSAPRTAAGPTVATRPRAPVTSHSTTAGNPQPAAALRRARLAPGLRPAARLPGRRLPGRFARRSALRRRRGLAGAAGSSRSVPARTPALLADAPPAVRLRADANVGELQLRERIADRRDLLRRDRAPAAADGREPPRSRADLGGVTLPLGSGHQPVRRIRG